MTTRPRRAWAFAAVAIGALALTAISLQRARRQPSPSAAPQGGTAVLAAPPAAPYVVVRDLRSGDSWGRLSLAPLAAPDGARYVTDLRCVRAYFAGGRGLCLVVSGATSEAIVFDAGFTPTHTLALTGAPSRARVSRDGRRGAITVFEMGHSYAESGFSTRTTIVDLQAGVVEADVETFAFHDGETPIRRVDVNVWGVTFAADGNRFYATLAYGGTPHLIEGDVDRREARVLAKDVECPSLSPDGRTIAFKRADGLRWRLWTLDTASRDERLLAGETRNVDDQVEWLDDARLVYQFPSDEGNDLWALDVRDGSPPRRYMAGAWSPAVVRAAVDPVSR